MSTQPTESTPRPFSGLQTLLLFAAVAGIVFAVSRFGLMGTRPPAGESGPAVGKFAPNIEFAPLTGKQGFRLADHREKVVLINFWADWCGPCKVEFPHLVKVVQPLLQRPDFQMVSVNVPGGAGEREELAGDAQRFLDEHAAPFPAYLDEEQAGFDALLSVAKAPQGGIPMTVVVNKEGKIAGLWIGYSSGDEDEVARVLTVALEAKPEL